MKELPPDATVAQRRRALKTALGGFGAIAVTDNLPEQWLRPSVSTAFLPVHASASGRVILEEFNASVSGAENINLAIEFFTRDVPDNAEVQVAYSSADRALDEGDMAEGTVYTFEGEIATNPEGMGIPVWNETPVNEIEVQTGATAGTEVTAEITVEGFEPVQFFTETADPP